MKRSQKGFLVLGSLVVWAIYIFILSGGLASHVSPGVASVYGQVVLSAVTVFWAILIIYLLFAIIFYDLHILEQWRRTSLKKSPAPGSAVAPASPTGLIFWGIRITIMLPFAFLLVTESYLLLDKLSWMWVLALVFSLLTIVSRIFAARNLDEGRVLSWQIALIAAISIILSLFQTVLLSDQYKSTFHNIAVGTDKIFFAETAMKVTTLKPGLMRERIQKITTPGRSIKVANYCDTLGIYGKHLSAGNLAPELQPWEKLNSGHSIHAAWSVKLMEILKAPVSDVPGKQKQHALTQFLDYLRFTLESGKADNLKYVSHFRLGHQFLVVLTEAIQEAKLDQNKTIRRKLIQLYCAIKDSVDPSALKEILTHKEVEPCENP